MATGHGEGVMKVEGFALLAIVLLCPLTMGVMMFLMMRGMRGQHAPHRDEGD
jgi:hypothetical protein